MDWTTWQHPPKSGVLCGAMEVHLHTKKNEIIKHAFPKILQTCYFGYFGFGFYSNKLFLRNCTFAILCTLDMRRHSQPQPPKEIKSTYRKYSCSQYAKNQLYPGLLSYDITLKDL